jgi:hypothetical protein
MAMTTFLVEHHNYINYSIGCKCKARTKKSDSEKRTSLLHRGINYRGEMFIEQAPGWTERRNLERFKN